MQLSFKIFKINHTKWKAVFFIFLALLTCSRVQSQTIDISQLEAVADSTARIQMQKGITPGLSIAIAIDGKTVLSKGYGLADVEMEVKVTPETIFRTGSLTKQFTAAAVMKLVEAGEIDLQKPISDYLPGFELQGRNLTVRHLLNHTSGISIKKIPDSDKYKKLLLRPELDLTNEDLLELLSGGPFVFEPGEKYAYSNLGYMLLGLIINKVTGKPYAEYIEQNLFKPLGLENTVYCDVRRIIPNRAEGYEQENGKLINADYISMHTPGAAGGICSTVEDLLKWNSLLHPGKIVSGVSLREMTEATVLTNGKTNGYGYGLKLEKMGDHTKIFHGGSISGFQSVLSYYPGEKLSIAVLMNSDSGDPEQIEEALARSAFNMEIFNFSLSPEELAGYEGTYALKSKDKSLEIRVFLEEEQLKADIGGEGITPLLYQGNNTFVAALEKNLKLVFVKENGRARDVMFFAFGEELKGKRKL